MRSATLAVCFLVCGLLFGLLCGAAGATTYYWISPCYDDTVNWSPYQAGHDNWEYMYDHDAYRGPNVRLEGPTGGLGVFVEDAYLVTLRDDALNPWPAGGLNSYNMALLGSSVYPFSLNTGHFLAGYTDWNGYPRCDISVPLTSQGVWMYPWGRLYEFKSGTYATTPTSWDLTQQANLSGHDLFISADKFPSTSKVYSDEVWVRVWNRDANWPETQEPTSGILYISPSGDIVKGWLPNGPGAHSSRVADHDGDVTTAYISTASTTPVTDEYALPAQDIGVLNTYERMQLIARVATTGTGTADLKVSYVDRGFEMVDLVVSGFSTGGAWQVYRGPIVRGASWNPGADVPLSSMVVEGSVSGSCTLKVEELYLRLW